LIHAARTEKKILNMKINLQKVTFHNGVVVAAKPVVVVAANQPTPMGGLRPNA